jgi:hypothetical protein
MKNWMRRCLVGLLLVVLVGSTSMMMGCAGKAKERTTPPNSKEKILDPGSVKMEAPAGGAPAGGAPEQGQGQ